MTSARAIVLALAAAALADGGLPESTTADALRTALGPASEATIGEAVGEGQERLVVFGPADKLAPAAKVASTVGAKLACGLVTVDRTL